MQHHTIINFKIRRYYQNKLRFDGVYSRNCVPKRKDEKNVIYLDEYKQIATQWIALYANSSNGTCLDGFGFEHIPEDIQKLVGKKNHNNYL